MKTGIIIILTVALTWYVATFGLPVKRSSCESLALFHNQQTSLSFSLEYEVYILINEQRILAGIDSLEWSEELAELAEKHSQKMLEDNNLVHSKADYYENIFAYIGYSSGGHIAQECIESWIESTPHRENLLNIKLSKCGIGVAQSGTRTYITYMAD